MQRKKAQVTIFIIIAILLTAVALFSYFIFISKPSTIPAQIQPIERYYLDCINEKAEETVALAGMQGGYLEMPEFKPGSEYKQFSNYYMFLGAEIPYWYYVSGNNIQTEQVPTKEEIEKQISNYLKQEIRECSLDHFEDEGFIIQESSNMGISTTIKESSIDIVVNKEIKIEYGDVKATISSHKTTIKSSFGSLYEEALDIYKFEKNSAFLENYTIDTLYLNAPVTGIDISCAPKVWVKEQVRQDLKNSIAANLAQVKLKGTYYNLASSLNKYFVVDTGKTIKENINFLASEPYRIEIWPSEDAFLVAEPVGLQPGLNLMGFCYVPYHFVYDIDFPVLIQLSKDDEIFQFPMAIVIDKTVPRKAETGETGEFEINICNYAGSVGTVYTYNQDNSPLEAKISFKCLNQVCPIGITKKSQDKSSITSQFPQCLNGFVIAESPGYAKTKTQISSNSPFTTSLYLTQLKKFNVNLNIKADETAIITFSSDEHSTTLFYPEQKEIELTSTAYQVTAQVFKQKNLQIGTIAGETCINVPDWLGIPHEECYNVEIPQQQITDVLFGGGITEFAPTSQEIKSKSILSIKIPTTEVPSTLEELQDVYSLIEISELELALN